MFKSDFLEEKKRLRTQQANKNKIVIEGRDNMYLIKKSSKNVSVSIKYDGRKSWILDGEFDTFNGAMAYVHKCLAFESAESLESI